MGIKKENISRPMELITHQSCFAPDSRVKYELGATFDKKRRAQLKICDLNFHTRHRYKEVSVIGPSVQASGSHTNPVN